MNNPLPNTIDPKAIEQVEKKFDSEVNQLHEQLKATHIKKEFTFSTDEKRRLSQMQLMAIFIRDAIDDIINLSVLPRVNIIPNKEVRILYDISLGRLMVWTPKEETKA